MKSITDREKQMVKASLHLAEIDLKYGYVPDYELINNKFDLTPDEMREIRDAVQESR
ncbi:MAG: hypothetical protein M0P12_04545 [Paludibacteraceae bacterium]|jgi:hypothetical protein|nr:hypothetical protein [Paludibacteraceae bacterium]MCK9615798.1 hypothetical protein [Candidatus Omnitrophota bacterium]